jgi:MraZ protein
MIVVAGSGLKLTKVESDPNSAPAYDAPRGFHQARCDEKGRVKLPAALHQYLRALGEKKLFVTTLDERTARLYPISSWKETEKILENAGDDAEAAEHVTFLANHYGVDSDMDDQGRLLLPKELRQELGLENQPVWLLWSKGKIEMLGETVYKQRFDEARGRKTDALARLKARGV